MINTDQYDLFAQPVSEREYEFYTLITERRQCRSCGRRVELEPNGECGWCNERLAQS